MRCVFYGEAAGLTFDRANPYGALLARAMAKLDVELVAGYASDLSEAWLIENRQHVDVLHLNWPHLMYQAPDLAGRLARCADLIGHLAHARLLGYKVVWTMHNLYPHETINHDLDRLVQLGITHLATAIIVHCRRARELLRQHFSRAEDVFLIPHGHFIDVYPNTITRSEARRRLDLPEHHFVYLYFGNARQYKGLERLLEVFTRLPDDDVTLLLAARVYNAYSAEVVEKVRHADPRVVVHSSPHFPNEELQTYFNAADVVVLPFLNVLTSGSAIAAMSFGRPVIVPAMGCLPELVDDSVGILYDPQQPDGLFQALRAIRQRDVAAMGAAAYRRAQSFSWDEIARQTLEVYQH